MKLVYLTISYIQRHLDYFHSIVAKLSAIERHSCQEPETLSVGHFYKIVRRKMS